MGRDKNMPVVALLSGVPTVCLQMWLFLMRSAGSCDLHPPEADHKSNHKGTVGSSPTPARLVLVGSTPKRSESDAGHRSELLYHSY